MVDGSALGGVDGLGVRELEAGVHVGAEQGNGAVVASNGEAAVAVDGLDFPAGPVLHVTSSGPPTSPVTD